MTTTSEKKCSVKNCDKKIYSKGMCIEHYNRMRIFGRTEKKNIENIGKICSVEGCNKKAFCKGICSKHYSRIRTNGNTARKNIRNSEKICSTEGCEEQVYSKGYCKLHYNRMYLYGSTDKRERKLNKIINHNNYSEIVVCDRKHNEVARTKIDKEDVEKIKPFKWYLDAYGYIKTVAKNSEGKFTTIALARILMNAPKGKVVDHINHDTTNNLKSNLRIVTQQQNCMNKKKVKGYCWCEPAQKWHVRIMVNKKYIHLGYFEKETDAIKARKKATLKYYGEYAYDSTL